MATDVRQLDSLGRMILPIEMRKYLRLSAGDRIDVDFRVDEDGIPCILLRPHDAKSTALLLLDRLRDEAQNSGIEDKDTILFLIERLQVVFSRCQSFPGESPD